jgi:hypothetical protein
MSTFTSQFQPNYTRKQRIRNRYVGKSHSLAFAKDGVIYERYIRYQAATPPCDPRTPATAVRSGCESPALFNEVEPIRFIPSRHLP